MARTGFKRKREEEEEDVTQSTSVSRLKSQLRQARRLLAKDDIKLDLRTTTERRVEALETQLGMAEAVKKETKLATRYHGVKFIERKKVVRKINQLKTQLASLPADDEQRKVLETTLKHYRIDLHYITSFPADSRYVALFPDGKYVDHDVASREDPALRSTDESRAAMRKAIRKRIKKGDLAAEPEFSLGKDDDDLPFTSSKPRRTDLKSSKQEKVEETALAQDDFFEA